MCTCHSAERGEGWEEGAPEMTKDTTFDKAGFPAAKMAPTEQVISAVCKAPRARSLK